MILGAGFIWAPGAGDARRCGCVNTVRAKRSGLSKPIVQTRNGSASVNATGSIGIRKAIAIGREIKRARMALETIARGNQKLEPSFLERVIRRKKVVCMRMYPARIRRMSRESAFLARSQKRRTRVRAA